MRNESAIRDILIDNTIHLVAEGGFEVATTKAITHGTSDEKPEIRMNEVYIYRLYGGKTQLYDAAFCRLDRQLFGALRACLQEVGEMEGDVKSKLLTIFARTWTFLLQNEDCCRCYIRYYYSVYFKENSRNAHNKLFDEVIDDFRPLFRSGADVTSIMHSVFTTLLDFAIRVYNGDLANTPNNREHIFNVLYCTMNTYFDPNLMPVQQII